MFSRPPLLLFHAKTITWEVAEPFNVTWSGGVFWVPKGFKTDLASIPRFARSFLPQVDRHLQAAIAHDFVYAGGTSMTRLQADEMFLAAMKNLGVWWWRRQVMYRAVRLFGGAFWKGKKDD